MVARFLGWIGFANLQRRAVRERYAAELAAVGLSVADLHAAWRLARRKAKRPIGLMAHWIRHGLVKSVLDEARSRSKPRAQEPMHPVVARAFAQAEGAEGGDAKSIRRVATAGSASVLAPPGYQAAPPPAEVAGLIAQVAAIDRALALCPTASWQARRAAEAKLARLEAEIAELEADQRKAVAS